MTNNRKQQIVNAEKAAATNVLFPIILLVLFFLAFAKSVKSQVAYVNYAATGANDGTSWFNAYSSLQTAIENAGIGSQIWVARGTYKPNVYPIGTTDGSSERDYAFTLKNGVAIYGGFIANEALLSARNVADNATILSGDIGIIGDNADNCYHVIIGDYINNTATLDGFVIRDGNANVNSITTHTPSGHILPSHSGGGMFLNFASPTIVNCVITNNDAVYAGGGVVAQGRSDESFFNCVFSNNRILSSTFGGGGLYNYAHPSNPSFPTVTNCVFYNNISLGAGGAIYTQYSNMTITNSTIFNNTAQQWGGGIYNEDSSNMVIRNCIIWGNNGNFITHPAGSDAGLTWNVVEPNVRYSLLQTYSTYSSNITGNPLFINSADADGADNKWATNDDGLALQGSSICINAGTNTISPIVDILNVSRPIGGVVDMGAYETNTTLLTITAINGSGGSISPVGTTTVAYSSNQTYHITPNAGYCIADVLVDGVSVYASLGIGASFVYTFNNVTSNHTIVASFVTSVVPSVRISVPRNNICRGSDVNITATPTNGGTMPIYHFYVDGISQGISSSPTFNIAALSVGLHQVYCVMLASNICQTSSSVTSNVININIGNPTVLAPIAGAINSCLIGINSRLYNTAGAGLWTSSNTSVATVNSSTGMVTPLAVGLTVISFTYTNNFGCNSSVSTNFNVAPIGTIQQIEGPTSVCMGSSITLSNATPGGVWSSIAGRATVNSSGVVTGISSGVAQIRYTISNAFGCVAYVGKNITVNNAPPVPRIAYAVGTINPQRGPGGSFCNSRTFTLVGTPAGGVWSSSNPSVITINSITGEAATIGVGSGSITYTYAASGCSNSRTIVGNVVNCATPRGIVENEIVDKGFLLFPNPAKTQVKLQLENITANADVIITDVFGKTVKKQVINIGTNNIDISNLAKGLYFVSVHTNESVYSKKLIIE